jgi:hypothetical protein
MKKPTSMTKQLALLGSIIAASLLALVVRFLGLFQRRERTPATPHRPSNAQSDQSPSTPSPTPPSSSDNLISTNIALHQRVQELEGLIHKLEQQQREAGIRPVVDLKVRLRAGLILVPALLLASISPVMVVMDRWLDKTDFRFAPQSAWCNIDFFCQTTLPSYYAFILASFVVLMIFLLIVVRERSDDLRSSPTYSDAIRSTAIARREIHRRASLGLKVGAAVGFAITIIIGLVNDQPPSWLPLLVLIAYITGEILEEGSSFHLWDYLRLNAPKLFSIILAQLTLIIFLASFSSGGEFRWVFAILLILGMGNLYRYRREISPVIWVVTLAVVLYTLKINSWRYSTIGDEYSFYSFAKYIAEEQRASDIINSLFVGNAVYGTHPYFSSLLQAISMMFFGSDNFGWRFSSIYLCALSIGFFFLFFKTFLSQRVALIISVLLASSHYLMNFGKIGYNNLQALFMMSVVLWAASWAVQTKRPIAFTILGLSMGTCLYVYPAAFYVLPLPILLLLFFLPPTSSQALRSWLRMLAGFCLLLLPLLFQPEYWQVKIAGTLFYTPEIAQTSSRLLTHFSSNLLYTFFSYAYIPEESHFIVASYVDPLTTVFLPIGIVLLLKLAPKQRFAVFIAIALIVESFLVGASHDRFFPPNTRMFLMLPWFFLFAAMGIVWTIKQVMRIASFRWRETSLMGIVLAGILGLNLTQSLWLFPERTLGIPNLEILFLRMLQHDQKEDPKRSKVYLFITKTDWGIDGIRTLQEAYSVPDSQAQLLRLAVSEPELPDWAVNRILEENTVVIIQPWMEDTLQEPIAASLSELGKVSCDVSNTPQVEPRFTFWYSPGYEKLCQVAATTY